jgi:hypothetical protein
MRHGLRTIQTVRGFAKDTGSPGSRRFRFMRHGTHTLRLMDPFREHHGFTYGGIASADVISA